MPQLEKDPSREGRENNETEKQNTEPLSQFRSGKPYLQVRESVRQLHGQDQDQERTALYTNTESRALSFPHLDFTSALVTSVTRHVDAISPCNSPVGEPPPHSPLSLNSSSEMEGVERGLLRRAYSVGSTANLHTSASAHGRRPSSLTEFALLSGTASYVQTSSTNAVRSFQPVQATGPELLSADSDSGMFSSAALPASFVVTFDGRAALPDIQLPMSASALNKVGGTAASGSSTSKSTGAGGSCMAPISSAVSKLIPGSQASTANPGAAADQSDDLLGAVGGMQLFSIMPVPSSSRFTHGLVSTAFQSGSQNAELSNKNTEEDDVFEEDKATFLLLPPMQRNLQRMPTIHGCRRSSCIF